MFEYLKDCSTRCQKWLVDDLVFTGLILLFVAIASFGLGRWSVLEHGSTPAERPVLVPTPVPVEQTATAFGSMPVEPGSGESATPSTATFVASINGTKYHALSCPGAKQINEQNKIYFQSEQQARAAGYTPAANCSF